ncbi:MAG: MBL fold metallo-hydrolase [Rhodospirillaceae bacterium]|nr:MBL fold metallo-hydrolase [Rhodospirillaceae bacterium]
MRTLLRTPILALSVMLAFTACSTAQQPASTATPFGTLSAVTTDLGDGLYTVSAGGYRTVFLVGDNGVLVGDPISTPIAKQFLSEIRKVTSKPLLYVVYSHNHWDHVLGGQVFKDEGAEIWSHEACLPHFYRNSHPDLVLPDHSYEQKQVLDVGNAKAELLYHGPNHSDCSTHLYFPAQKIVHIVDTVQPYAVSGAGGRMNDSYPKQFVASLQKLEDEVPFERMVPGHGGPIAPRDAVTNRREYQQGLLDAVKAEIDKGTPFGEIPGAVSLPQFKDLLGYDQYLAANAQRILIYYTIGW